MSTDTLDRTDTDVDLAALFEESIPFSDYREF